MYKDSRRQSVGYGHGHWQDAGKNNKIFPSLFALSYNITSDKANNIRTQATRLILFYVSFEIYHS